MEKMLIMESRIGKLYLVEEDNQLTALLFNEPKNKGLVEETLFLLDVKKQLEEYFDNKRKCFEVKFKLKGTEFQKRVWQALYQIPYGETRSYQQIAEAIDCPKGCRAVGLANNHNPISIIVPCHRVIGKNGKMVGYGGGIGKKEELLKLEKENGR